ncbi:MAG: YbdD/YjiX family protein [Mycobacterium sp.]
MGRLGDLGSGLVRRIGWYVGTLMGDNHYRRYLEHRRRTHPGQPVLSEAAYWRVRHEQAGRSPGARCC